MRRNFQGYTTDAAPALIGFEHDVWNRIVSVAVPLEAPPLASPASARSAGLRR